jgi:hypothetical protein
MMMGDDDDEDEEEEASSPLSSSSFQVLLASLRNDNSGITIASAKYVILAEPSLDRAIEQQAISRVCRLGSNHATVFALKFYCNDTIDEQLLRRDELKRRQQQAQQKKQTHEHSNGALLRSVRSEQVSMPLMLELLGLTDKPAAAAAAAAVSAGDGNDNGANNDNNDNAAAAADAADDDDMMMMTKTKSV